MNKYKKQIINILKEKYNIQIDNNYSLEKILSILNKNGYSYDDVINYLLSLNNERIDDELWNSFYIFEDLDILKSNKFKELYDEYLILKDKNNNELSINKTLDIISNDIILKIITDDLSKYIIDKYKDLDEFQEYTSDIINLHKNDRFSFLIFDKHTNEIVGFIGLYCSDYAFIETENTYMNEYYIFPEYRRKHYASKALSLLTDAALNNKITIYSDKKRRYQFIESIEDIKLVYGLVHKENIGSYKTQLRANYEHLGQICHIRNNQYMRDELFIRVREELINFTE